MLSKLRHCICAYNRITLVVQNYGETLNSLHSSGGLICLGIAFANSFIIFLKNEEEYIMNYKSFELTIY